MSDRSEQGQLIEAEQQRQEDVHLESALGEDCCPECGAPLYLGHGMVEWEINGRRFSQPCPYSGARPACEF